jgi:hypothetical protein
MDIHKLKNKHFIFPSAAIALAGFILSINRPTLFGLSHFSDLLLGSAPSFLCVLGLSLLASFILQTSTSKRFLLVSCSVAVGVLIHEVQQYWSPKVFDLMDIGACLLAIPVAYILYCRVEKSL